MTKRPLPPHPATVVQRRALPPHPATVVQRRALPPHPATVVQPRPSSFGWPSRPIHDTSARPSRPTRDLGMPRRTTSAAEGVALEFRAGPARVGAVQCKACGTVQRSSSSTPTTIEVTVDGHYWLWTTDLSITVLGTSFPDNLGGPPAYDQGCGRLSYLIGNTWHSTEWTSWTRPSMSKSEHIERRVVAALQTAVSDVTGKVKATVL